MKTPEIKIFMWPTTAMIIFTGLQSPAHEHVAMQFATAVDGEPRIQTSEGRWLNAPAILIPQNIEHGYDGREGLHLVLWIEPESVAGRTIRARHEEEIQLLHDPDFGAFDAEIRKAFDDDYSAEQATDLRNRIIETLAGGKPESKPLDPRVGRVLELLREHRTETVGIAWLAEEVGLSESRLSHLFSDEVGVPISRYRMWLRALEATRLLSEGSNVTEAAHASGFSDTAHLSRTFSMLFGQSPAEAMSISRGMLAIDEDLTR